MARDHKLKAALERHKGVNHKLEHQKKLQKQAEKRRKQQPRREIDDEESEDNSDGIEEDEEVQALASTAEQRKLENLAADGAAKAEAREGEADGWETDGSEEAQDEENGGVGIKGPNDVLKSDTGSESEFEDENENEQSRANGTIHDETADLAEDTEDEDIPLSDIESLASEDKADVIPHQHLTINNTTALQRSLRSFALPASLPFSATQSVTSTEPTEIADVEDDLNRELAFYKQSLQAVKEARIALKKEGIPFSRPADYFAEMVKSEEQMGKVRQKVLDREARKRASADARRQRDLKKFGKAVQVAKLQERDRTKRETMDKINLLKRKRQGAELNANEDDMFDVALEDAAETAKADRAARRANGAAPGPNRKRQKKEEKWGFGGKKRFAKSNDALSSGDMRRYSVKKMKGSGGRQRPGKSRRAKMA